MNDDLKAYIDGELPPDAAERVRQLLAVDPALRAEEESIRHLGRALRALPEPEPVGQAATLAALSNRRSSLFRVWTPALAGCATLIFAASLFSHRQTQPRFTQTTTEIVAAASAETSIPAARRTAFIRYIHALGGEVRKDGDGLRAFYPQTDHEEVKRRFLLPNDLPWPTDGLRVALTP